LSSGSLNIGSHGTLELGIGSTIGSTPIVFNGTGGTLKIDGTAMPTGMISGFGPNDTIDLRGVSFVGHSSTIFQSSTNGGNDVLQIIQFGTPYSIQLDSANSYVGGFALSPDGFGGTDITFKAATPVVGTTDIAALPPPFAGTSDYST